MTLLAYLYNHLNYDSNEYCKTLYDSNHLTSGSYNHFLLFFQYRIQVFIEVIFDILHVHVDRVLQGQALLSTNLL